MADIRHKRNGILISEPRNFEDIQITKDFLNNSEDSAINTSKLIFAGEEGVALTNRILNGLTGGLGMYEGDKYEIEVGTIGNPEFVYDGYLDFTDSEFIGCNEVAVSLKKRRGNDWLNDVADGFSFRYLQEIGIINSSDFVKVPYVINYVPDNMQVILLSISLFMMTKELIESIKATAEAIADVTDASIPVVGVGVGLGAVAVTAWDIGNVVLTVIKVAAYIAYTIAMVVAIKNLIEEIIEQLIPKKRDHLGIGLKTLFQKACQHLNLTLSSTVLDKRSNWVIIPNKGHKGGEKPEGFTGTFIETGVPGIDDPFDTFGDLIRIWGDTLNSKVTIIGTVLHFERVDHKFSQSTFKIDDNFTDQERHIDRYTTNANELVSNYALDWSTDVQDQNTLDNQEGRLFQAILEPNTSTNKDLVMMKNLQEIINPCSLGLRKNDLTKIEEVLKKLAEFIDNLTGILGGGTSFVSKIEARKGSLLLSSHFLSKPKVVVMSGSKLANNQRGLLSQKRIWDELHFINSFKEINGEHNQRFIYKGVKVKFCIEDYISLLDSQEAETADGQEAMIDVLKWKVRDNYAIIDYRIKKKFTNNLKITYLT